LPADLERGAKDWPCSLALIPSPASQSASHTLRLLPPPPRSPLHRTRQEDSRDRTVAWRGQVLFLILIGGQGDYLPPEGHEAGCKCRRGRCPEEATRIETREPAKTACTSPFHRPGLGAILHFSWAAQWCPFTCFRPTRPGSCTDRRSRLENQVALEKTERTSVAI